MDGLENLPALRQAVGSGRRQQSPRSPAPAWWGRAAASAAISVGRAGRGAHAALPRTRGRTSTVRGFQVLPPSNVSSSVWRVPSRKPWSGSLPVKPTSSSTTSLSTGSSTTSQSPEMGRLASAGGGEGSCAAAPSARPAPSRERRVAEGAAALVLAASGSGPDMARGAATVRRCVRLTARASTKGAAPGNTRIDGHRERANSYSDPCIAPQRCHGPKIGAKVVPHWLADASAHLSPDKRVPTPSPIMLR